MNIYIYTMYKYIWAYVHIDVRMNYILFAYYVYMYICKYYVYYLHVCF